MEEDTLSSGFDLQLTKLVDQYLDQNTTNTIGTVPSNPASKPDLLKELDHLVHQQDPSKNLLRVVQAARPSLTSESDPSRASAIRLLVQLVTSLADHNLISKTQVTFLVGFFAEKLSDAPAILLEALGGLKCLTKASDFQSQHTLTCCQALFTHVPNRNLDQPKRFAVLALLDHLLAFHRQDLKAMGSEFLTGYSSIVEGEKDPRNLVVAFRLAKVILTEFDLGDQVENMFDITFCYFPITFRPPPGNPEAYGGVTAEDLTRGLIACLSATSRFGTFALPLLLDKLQAPGLGPKTQVLETMVQAFPIYGQAAVAEFAPLFWESLLVEIFQPHTSPNKDFVRLQKLACQTLFKTIFPPGVDFSPSGPINMIQEAIETLMKELHSPEKSKAIPAARLVCWIIESGANTIDVILYTILTSVSTLLKLWKGTPTTAEDDVSKKRPSILGHLGTIFGSIAAISGEETESTNPPSHDWFPASIRDEILETLIKGVPQDINQATESLTQVAALRALQRFAAIPGSLDSQEARKVAGIVTRSLAVTDDEEVINAATETLSTLAESHPDELINETLPELFRSLPGTLLFQESPSSSSIPSTNNYIKILEALATLCDRQPLFQPFLVNLLDELDCSASLARTNCIENSDVPFDPRSYCHHLLSCLYTVLVSIVQSTNDRSTSLLCCIIGRLFKILLSEEEDASVGREHSSIRNDKEFIISAGRIINLLVRQFDSKKQQEFVTKLHAAYHMGHVEELIAGSREYFPSSKFPQYKKVLAKFAPMTLGATDPDLNMMVLYAEALIAIRPGIKVPDEILSTVEFPTFKYYFEASKASPSNFMVSQASLRLLCSTVNRRFGDFPDFFGEQLDRFWDSELSHSSSSSSPQPRSRKAALDIWLWIVKGLIVRSEVRGYELLDRVCDLLAKHPSSFAWWSARRLVLIIDQNDETLSSKNFAITKLLWLQKVSLHLISRFVQGYHESSANSRTVYLGGLATFLARVPSQLVCLQHTKVIPLLLEALKLDEILVKSDALATLYALVNSNNDLEVIFEKNLKLLVDALLSNCIFEQPARSDRASQPSVTSEAIRSTALQILTLLAERVRSDASSDDQQKNKKADQILRAVLLDAKPKALRTLTIALDDPKRRVRALAVDCRAHWFLLSSSASS